MAIFFQEEGDEMLTRKLAEGGEVGIGAPTLVETGIVLSARLGQDARALLAPMRADVVEMSAPAATHAGNWWFAGFRNHVDCAGDCLRPWW